MSCASSSCIPRSSERQLALRRPSPAERADTGALLSTFKYLTRALDALQGKALFSVFDFPAAYYQVKVEKSSRPYLAFITPDGH